MHAQAIPVALEQKLDAVTAGDADAARGAEPSTAPKMPLARAAAMIVRFMMLRLSP